MLWGIGSIKIESNLVSLSSNNKKIAKFKNSTESDELLTQKKMKGTSKKRTRNEVKVG